MKICPAYDGRTDVTKRSLFETFLLRKIKYPFYVTVFPYV